MAINEKLIVQEAAAGVDADPNIMLDLNAGDVDSYDGDGDVWYDIHDFEFTPTTNVSEHFNTVIWSGDGALTRSITGVGFQPDLVWIKTRSNTVHHTLHDSVRGAGTSGTNKAIFTSATSGENIGDADVYGFVSDFDSDGFELTGGSASNTSDKTTYNNRSSFTYVAWCFNAGGVEETNTEGTIDSTVRANNDLGFSIAKYIGNGSSTGATVGHGLDTPPEMIIVKDLDDASDWAVYSSVTGNTKKLLLNSRNGAAASGVWNNTSPTSSVFNVRYSQTNELNNDFIAYSFTSKRGVSKVGSYIGNGTTNNKIYTGFEPAFFMLKNTSLDNTGWLIKDNVRGENSKTLLANSSIYEYNTTAYWTCDFERDGVRLTYGADNEFNRNGDTYIFYAVAKDTNETSLIPDTDLELNLEADSYSGSGNWLDSSGNGNNGTITGATWEKELGNFFEFNGSSDKVEGSISGIGSQFTVELWVSPNDFTGNENLFELYDSATDASNNRIFFSGGSLLASKNGGGGGFAQKTSITSVMTIGKWHHVVARYDSNSSIKLYVDTVKVAEDLSVSGTFNIANFAIGVNNDYTQGERNFANAKIGQVRVYDTILTEAQIRQNFNFTKPKYPNEFHGDIIGTPSWNIEGSFNISGGNYINLGSDEAINFSTNSSISVWVNSSNSTGSKGILGRFNNTSPYGYVLYQSSGNVGFSLYDSSGNGSFTATTPLTNSTWTHFVITYDGSNLILYKNGTSVSNVASTRIPSTPSANTLIGRYYSNVNVTTYDFAGKISKVKFYNTAITQSEVDALYNEGE